MLGGGTLAAIGLATYVLFQAMDVLGGYIPYQWEKAISAPFVAALSRGEKGNGSTSRHLKGMAQRLSGVMDMPGEMEITLNFLHDRKVNAFATLGGNIVFYEGLVARMPNENALAMVLAHEIAHVKNRDVIRGITAGLAYTVVVSVVFGDAGWAEEFIAGEGLLTALHFSRRHEQAADEQALAALVRVYGHAGGFEDMFRALDQARQGQKLPPALLSTHPRIEARIAHLKKLAQRNGWAVSGKLTPLRLKPEVSR